MIYTDEDIARVVHEANRGLQYVQGGAHPSDPWDVTPAGIREVTIAGVRAAREGAGPQESHEKWCQGKRHQGWHYGPVKDEQARTHPCLVPYADLPDGQKLKDDIFIAIVTLMDGARRP